MSWMSRLYQTYEQALEQGDISGEEKPIPVAHTIQNAHINIIINGKGDFLDASILPEKTQIILPATESSAGRSSGEAPHPLADKVQYVAGDYARYGGLKAAYFSSYQRQLAQWVESDDTPLSIQAIYRYISQRSVVADLVQDAVKVLWVDNKGCLLTSWDNQDVEPPEIFKTLPKEKGQLDQGNALVCWTVEAADIKCADTWKDPALQKRWAQYDEQQGNISALCYVSGEVEAIALNHPAKLRHSGDKAKLISSNDFAGYTFKGRFTDTQKTVNAGGLQGATIGNITSQKAHNALRWLINRQGHWARMEDQIIVTWAVSTEPVIHPFEEAVWLDDDWWNASDQEEVTDDIQGPADEVDQMQPDQSLDLGYAYSKKLNKHMNGYRQSIDVDDTISVMAIDSATPGRMAVTYYRESMPKDYLDDITVWHEDFAWPQRHKREIDQRNGKAKKVTVWHVQAPAPRAILDGVYGDILKSNKKLGKQLYQRLLSCMLDRADIPQDILKRALSEASRFANKEYCEWERSLGVACALYKGHFIRHSDHNQQRTYSMALDTTITSRDYLYGRLLALAEKLESTALRLADAKRPTTANRLMQRFADRPYSTWLTIYKQLDPYIRQLTSSKPGFLTNIRKEIDEVTAAFERNEFMKDEALSGEFLLGFHCQRLTLRSQAKNNTNDSEPQQGDQ